MVQKHFDQAIQDLWYAVRLMLRTPLVTACVVLSLALGFGANTAMFSLVDSLLLQRLPVHEPEQLVQLTRRAPTFTADTFSRPLFGELQQADLGLADMFGSSGVSSIRWEPGGPPSETIDELRRVFVSANYFEALGVRPVIGRGFTADEDRGDGRHPVAVIGHALWQRSLGGTPDVLGRTLRIGDTIYTVVGVAPPSFFGIDVGQSADVWLPLTMQSRALLTSRTDAWLRVLGRRRPDATGSQPAERATARLRAFLAHDLGSAPPQTSAQEKADYVNQTIEITPASRGLSRVREEMAQPLLVLLAMVAVLLLVACANVANLLLARAAARWKEIATRLALGAGQARVMRQLATEGLLLAAVAAVLGLLLAPTATMALLRLVERGPADPSLQFQTDARILLFTAGIALLTGILCGLGPALRARRTDLIAAIKDGATIGNTSKGSLRIGRGLVVVQVAISVVLVIAASLLVRSFKKLNDVDAGFSRSDVLVGRITVAPSGASGAGLTAAYAQVLERLRALPGVKSAAMSSMGVFGSGTRLDAVFVKGVPMPPRMEDIPLSHVLEVSPAFFDAMGMQWRRGRAFTDADGPETPQVAVINETLARRHFPNEDPVGRRFGLDGPESSEQIEIVGVVNDIKYGNLRSDRPSMFFLPLGQAPSAPRAVTLIIRGDGTPLRLVRPIRTELAGIGQGLILASLNSQDELVGESVRRERLVASLSALFGSLSLLLACTGLFGVVSYTVTRRTSEFGIRMALGATPGHVFRFVLRETLTLVAIGVVIGLAGGIAAGGFLRTLLFGLEPTDPVSFGAAAVMVLVVSAAAGAIPASKVVRLNPVTTLKAE